MISSQGPWLVIVIYRFPWYIGPGYIGPGYIGPCVEFWVPQTPWIIMIFPIISLISTWKHPIWGSTMSGQPPQHTVAYDLPFTMNFTLAHEMINLQIWRVYHGLSHQFLVTIRGGSWSLFLLDLPHWSYWFSLNHEWSNHNQPQSLVIPLLLHPWIIGFTTWIPSPQLNLLESSEFIHLRADSFSQLEPREIGGDHDAGCCVKKGHARVFDG